MSGNKVSPLGGLSCAENGAEDFLVTDWGPFSSLDQNVWLKETADVFSHVDDVPHSPEINSSHDGTKQIAWCSSLGSEMIGSSCLAESSQTLAAASNELQIRSNSTRKRRKEMSDCLALSPQSLYDRTQNARTEWHKDVPAGIANGAMEEDENKDYEHNVDVNCHNLTAQLAEECHQIVDATKEDYVRSRAKRGQATNSHRLAERVRRERISERMRFLQNLVPGCNKITGKAVMLDEIINYVKTLQQQVQFLSMKLAAVHPEINLNVEQNLLTHVHHPKRGNPAIPGHCSGLSSYHSHLNGASGHGSTKTGKIYPLVHSSGITISHISPMAQVPHLWDAELQNVFCAQINSDTPS